MILPIYSDRYTSKLTNDQDGVEVAGDPDRKVDAFFCQVYRPVTEIQGKADVRVLLLKLHQCRRHPQQRLTTFTLIQVIWLFSLCCAILINIEHVIYIEHFYDVSVKFSVLQG